MSANLDRAIAKISIKSMPGTGKSNINIETPIWTRIGKDGLLYANLALFGGITTFGKTEEDLDVAIKEALTCFFNSATKYGKGIKEELKMLGWQVTNNNKIRYKVNHKSKSFTDRTLGNGTFTKIPFGVAEGEMMKTGTRKQLSIAI